MKQKQRNKVGLNSRRKSALERLIIQHQNFVKQKQDKIKNNKTIPYIKECNRMENEIEILKNKIQW